MRQQLKQEFGKPLAKSSGAAPSDYLDNELGAVWTRDSPKNIQTEIWKENELRENRS